jgi:hypothetical protein
MSNAMLERIETVSYNTNFEDFDGVAPTDSVEILSRNLKEYAAVEGARDGEYNDDRDDLIRSMTNIARATFKYRYLYLRTYNLDPMARHFAYHMARVSFFKEFVDCYNTYAEVQENLDIHAFKRLFSGHYDDYLKEDKVPLPFEAVKKRRGN